MSGGDLLLSDAERERFASWLERDAESSRLLLEQLETLPAGKLVSNMMGLDMAASLRVAKRLRDMESHGIGAPPVGGT